MFVERENRGELVLVNTPAELLDWGVLPSESRCRERVPLMGESLLQDLMGSFSSEIAFTPDELSLGSLLRDRDNLWCEFSIIGGLERSREMLRERLLDRDIGSFPLSCPCQQVFF